MVYINHSHFSSAINELGLKYPFVKNNAQTIKEKMSNQFYRSGYYQRTGRPFMNKWNSLCRFKQSITDDEIKSGMNSICTGRLYMFKVLHENNELTFKVINKAIDFFGKSYSQLVSSYGFMSMHPELSAKIRNYLPSLNELLITIFQKYSIFMLGCFAYALEKSIKENNIAYLNNAYLWSVLDTNYWNGMDSFVVDLIRSADPVTKLDAYMVSDSRGIISSFMDGSMSYDSDDEDNPIGTVGGSPQQREKFREYCLKKHSEISPVYQSLREMNSSAFEQLIKASPDLHLFFGRHLGKKTILKVIVECLVSVKFSESLLSIFDKNVCAASSDTTDTIIKHQFVVPTQKTLSRLRVIEI
jgi:hypothetical protein